LNASHEPIIAFFTIGLTIIVNNHIKLPKSHLTPVLVQYLRDNLNFFNTEYLIKKRIGISTYQTEKYFKLITEESEHIYIPRGFLNNLLRFCREKQISYKTLDQRKLKLYDYQKKAVDEIGQISGRKKKIGKQITVAMMQSLVKMATIDDLTNQFGTIIIDECHHIPAGVPYLAAGLGPS